MNRKAVKMIGAKIGVLPLVALALVAMLAVNASPTDAQQRNLTESSVEVRYISSAHTGTPSDDGERRITITNDRIAQEFWVGQGGPNHAADGLGAHRYSIERMQVEQTWTGRHASTKVDARIYNSLGSGANLRPHSQVCTLEYASHTNDRMTFDAPDYGCQVYGLESYFVVLSLKDTANRAEIEITQDAVDGYDNWDMADHFLTSIGGSKTWTSDSHRLRVAIFARALYEDPPDVAYTWPKFIRANEGQPTTYHAKMVSQPRIAWNFRVDQGDSELTESMTCANGSAASSCLITPRNWGIPIAITVTPPHDDDGESAKFLMKHQVFQKAPHNNAENAVWEEDTLRIMVTDDDNYEFVGPSSVSILEGQGDNVPIRLGVKPAGNFRVTATITGFADQLAASSVFAFIGNDWTDGFSYFVLPTDDDVAQVRTGSITFSHTPGEEDPAWANIRPLTIPIKIIDDDVAGFALAPAVGSFTSYCPASMTTNCQGYDVEIDEDDFVRYTIKLLTEPLEPVTIRATHWRGVRVIENAEITYDSTNWNTATPPFFKVKANRFAFDARDRYAEVRYQVTSTGADYRNITIPPTRVTIKNIDTN